MIKDFKQFVPSSVCLKCDGCCRFKEADSQWRPHIGLAEMKAAAHPNLPDKIFARHVVGPDSRINPTPCAIGSSGGEGFLCHFFSEKDHTCGIYHARPFECQLYPFLISREGDRAILYSHLNCPHVQEHWNDPSYKEYGQYLQEFFRRKEVVQFLRDNPKMLVDYSAFRDELDIVCTIALE